MKKYKDKVNKLPRELASFIGIIYMSDISEEKLKELLLSKFYTDKYNKIIGQKNDWPEKYSELVGGDGDKVGLGYGERVRGEERREDKAKVEIKRKREEFIKERRDCELVEKLFIDINFFKPMTFVNMEIVKKFMKTVESNHFSLIPLKVEDALNKNEPHLIMFNERSEADDSNPYVTFVLNISEKIEYLTFFKDELEDSISLSPSSPITNQGEKGEKGKEENKGEKGKKENKGKKEEKEVTFNNPSDKGPRYFNLQQFLQLIENLKFCIENGNYNYISLLDKLNSFKDAFENQNKNIFRYKREYENLKQEDKFLCLRYLVSLFLLGQYLRWWKGPSFDWVYRWSENYAKNEKENIFRDQMVVELINDLEHILSIASPVCKTFLKSFKWIDYDIANGGFRIGADTLVYLYENLRNNNFCLADASDRFTKTSVALIFLLICDFDLGKKPDLDMYQKFSEYINFIMKIKISSEFKTFIFYPVKFEKSGHTDPTLQKKYET